MEFGIESDNAFQNWKLYRQFQRTLESLSLQDPNRDERNDDLLTHHEFLEVTSIEDEGEQIGGNDKFLELERQMALKSHFDLWRDLTSEEASKKRKARFYHRFNTLEKAFLAWKTVCRREMYKREQDNWAKALAFSERRILREALFTWRGYTRLMSSKKQLRSLELQKERSAAKVGQFLMNLKTLKRQLHVELDGHTHSKPKPVSEAWRKPALNTDLAAPELVTPPSSVDRLSPAKFDQGKFGAGDESQVDEAGFPLVSINEAANKVIHMRSLLDQTTVQRAMIREQSQRLLQQERELKAMEEMHMQLLTGRAITNVDLYRSLIFKKRHVTGTKPAELPKSSKPGGSFQKRQKSRSARRARDGKNSSGSDEMKTDISNLRGQAPVVQRKKPIRNIIVSQEEVRRVNREFLGEQEQEDQPEMGFPEKPDTPESYMETMRLTARNIFNVNDTSDMTATSRYNLDDENYSEPELQKLMNGEDLDESIIGKEKKNPPTPPFLRQMKKRQEKRAIRREEIRKFHQQKAEDKLRKEYQTRADQIQKEEEEKVKKRMEKMELRKQEKIQQKKHEEEVQRLKNLNAIAREFNTKRLIRNFGLVPWKHLLIESRMNHFLAEKHYEMSLAKRFFADWRHITRSSIIKLRVLAEEHYNKTILINTFRIWSEERKIRMKKAQAAFDFNEMRLVGSFFKNWRSITANETKRQFKLDLEALRFYKRTLLKRFLHQWIKYVAHKEAIQTREEIRRHFQAQVALQLSDYIPSTQDEI